MAGVIVTLVIGFLGLWGMLAGAGLFLAALTLAGQSIVLDYLMGILIILEGQYFKGDVIAVGAVAGTVEDVGLRRTTVRAADGTVHSISNGEIRIVSNRTRVFAAAEVVIPGIREEDFERVLEIMDDVGRQVAQDPRFTASIIETPSVAFIGDPDDLGMTATMRGKVVAGDRWTIATESAAVSIAPSWRRASCSTSAASCRASDAAWMSRPSTCRRPATTERARVQESSASRSEDEAQHEEHEHGQQSPGDHGQQHDGLERLRPLHQALADVHGTLREAGELEARHHRIHRCDPEVGDLHERGHVLGEPRGTSTNGRSSRRKSVIWTKAKNRPARRTTITPTV